MAPIASFERALKMPPEELKEGMKGWEPWMKENESVIVDGGSPLGKTKRITKGGAVSNVRNEIGAYSIVQAESLDAAAKIFEDSPHFWFEDGWIEVIEFVPMPN